MDWNKVKYFFKILDRMMTGPFILGTAILLPFMVIYSYIDYHNLVAICVLLVSGGLLSHMVIMTHIKYEIEKKLGLKPGSIGYHMPGFLWGRRYTSLKAKERKKVDEWYREYHKLNKKFRVYFMISSASILAGLAIFVLFLIGVIPLF